MSFLRRLQARVQRWHLLGRYYVNKWHYDSSKWLDCVLYGRGSTGNGPQVASVAFMITRAMRQQLVDAGFPSSAISSLQPAVVQKIISDKTTFTQFDELQKQQQVEKAANRAKQTLRREKAQAQQRSVLGTAETQHEAEHQANCETSTALVVLQKEDVKKTQS